MKIILFAIIAMVFSTTCTAQSNMQLHPTRYVANVYGTTGFEIISDSVTAKKYYKYPIASGQSLVILRVRHDQGNNVSTTYFRASTEEAQYLKSQAAKSNIQIALDDDIFVGYVKIIIY